jgi:hypothetical protein
LGSRFPLTKRTTYTCEIHRSSIILYYGSGEEKVAKATFDGC